jgi:preprotein translocase subunit YajC
LVGTTGQPGSDHNPTNKEGDHVLAAAGSTSGSSFLTFLPIILIFAAMYFLLIRPQSKRRREAQQLQSQLSPGDNVQTVGGLFGTVVSIDDEAVTIEASPGVNMRYTRGAIARVIKKDPLPESLSDDVEDDDDDAVDTNADAKKTIEQG